MIRRFLLIGLTIALAVLSTTAPTAAGKGVRAFRERAVPLAARANSERPRYPSQEAPRSPACDSHFCIHWATKGIDAPRLADGDGDGVPNYVERVLAVGAEVHAVEHGELGWREPRADGRRGGQRNKTDVYLAELGRVGLFGYAEPDGQSRGDRGPRRKHGYMVLDDDFSPRQYEMLSQNALKITFAHEYCHLLQIGYDGRQDRWFFESTAVWMEDQVYDQIDDYIGVVYRWVRRGGPPLTSNGADNAYGAAVWNHWLAGRYGPKIVRSAWSRAIDTQPDGFAVSAYDSAIRTAGGSDFSRDFARFAADIAEWRVGDRFPEGRLYPDFPRQGRLPRDGGMQKSGLEHTTFHLWDVDVRGGRAVVARGLAPRGVAAGLALVGRDAGERGRPGLTVTKLRFKRRGGAMTVRLGRPGRFERITAVLVNADTKLVDTAGSRRLYGADTARFRIGARVEP